MIDIFAKALNMDINCSKILNNVCDHFSNYLCNKINVSRKVHMKVYYNSDNKANYAEKLYFLVYGIGKQLIMDVMQMFHATTL